LPSCDSGERIVFSEKFACPVSGFTIAEIGRRRFRFNQPVSRLPGGATGWASR